EQRVGGDRVAGKAKPPAGIAEPHLLDATLDFERELVVTAARPPLLDTILRRRPLRGLELGMAVEHAKRHAIDPVAAGADLAVWHVGEPLPKRAAEDFERLLGGLAGQTAGKEEFGGHVEISRSEAVIARHNRSKNGVAPLVYDRAIQYPHASTRNN